MAKKKEEAEVEVEEVRSVVPEGYKGERVTVTITRGTRVGGESLKRGDVVEVTAADAVTLRTCGKAEKEPAGDAEAMSADNTGAVVTD